MLQQSLLGGGREEGGVGAGCVGGQGEDQDGGGGGEAGCQVDPGAVLEGGSVGQEGQEQGQDREVQGNKWDALNILNTLGILKGYQFTSISAWCRRGCRSGKSLGFGLVRVGRTIVVGGGSSVGRLHVWEVPVRGGSSVGRLWRLW